MYNKKDMPIYYGLVRTSGTGKIPNSSFFYPKTEWNTHTQFWPKTLRIKKSTSLESWSYVKM